MATSLDFEQDKPGNAVHARAAEPEQTRRHDFATGRRSRPAVDGDRPRGARWDARPVGLRRAGRGDRGGDQADPLRAADAQELSRRFPPGTAQSDRGRRRGSGRVGELTAADPGRSSRRGQLAGGPHSATAAGLLRPEGPRPPRVQAGPTGTPRRTEGPGGDGLSPGGRFLRISGACVGH